MSDAIDLRKEVYLPLQ